MSVQIGTIMETSRGGTMKNLIPEKNRINPCEKPMREFVISYDGSVQLCCHSYQNKEIDNGIAKINKLDDNSIFKIYTNKVLTDARKDLFSYSEKLEFAKHAIIMRITLEQELNFS